MSDIGKAKSQTKADRIRNMSDEELAKIYVYCWIAESVQHSNLVMLEVCAMQTYLNGFNQKRNSFEQLSGCEVEVIGNIFDDKELEKGE